MLTRVMRIPRKLFLLLRKNKVYEGEFFSVRVTYGARELHQAKCVCIVSKKISNRAVIRNKIKRRVYSILYSRMITPKDALIQVFPKKNTIGTTYKKLQEDLIQIIENNNIL